MPVEFKDSQCTFEFETTVHRLNSVTLPMIWIDAFCAAVILLAWVPQKYQSIRAARAARKSVQIEWKKIDVKAGVVPCSRDFLRSLRTPKQRDGFWIFVSGEMLSHKSWYPLFAFFSDNPIRKSRQSCITEAHWMRGRSRAPALSVIRRQACSVRKRWRCFTACEWRRWPAHGFVERYAF